MNRSPNANLNRHKSERPSCIALKREESPNPFSYKDKDTNWKKLSTVEDVAVPFIFKKNKSLRYVDEVAKKKSFIPGVAKYSLDASLNVISKGPQPRFKKGR